MRASSFPKRVDGWAFSYIPGMKICMVEPEAVNFIVSLGYGTITLDGARKSRPNSKPIYHWYIRSKDIACKFLLNVIPFLKVKKERAKFLLEFCQHLIKSGNPGYSGLTENEINYREDAYVKMRKFNGNEVAAETKPRGRESASDSPVL